MMQPKTGPNASIRERSGIQERIDRIHWYHEFDFGNGLRAEAKTPDAQSHRRLWRFVYLKLDKIDFTGKRCSISAVGTGLVELGRAELANSEPERMMPPISRTRWAQVRITVSVR
jgi:hypothetical protein